MKKLIVFVVVLLSIITTYFFTLNERKDKINYPFNNDKVFGYNLGDVINDDSLDSNELADKGVLGKNVKPKEIFRRFADYRIRVTPNKHKVCQLSMGSRFADYTVFNNELEELKNILKIQYGEMKKEEIETFSNIEYRRRVFNEKPRIELITFKLFFRLWIQLLISDEEIKKEG